MLKKRLLTLTLSILFVWSTCCLNVSATNSINETPIQKILIDVQSLEPSIDLSNAEIVHYPPVFPLIPKGLKTVQSVFCQKKMEWLNMSFWFLAKLIKMEILWIVLPHFLLILGKICTLTILWILLFTFHVITS